jgi:hypothetical protein
MSFQGNPDLFVIARNFVPKQSLSRGRLVSVVISWRSLALARDAFGGLPRFARNDEVFSNNQGFPSIILPALWISTVMQTHVGVFSGFLFFS